MIADTIGSIEYKSGEMFINNKKIDGQSNFIKDGALQNRFLKTEINEKFIKSFLQGKPFNSVRKLRQIAAFTRDGFFTYIPNS